MSAAATPSSPWVQGPRSDLLFGAGLVYLPILALSLAAGSDLRIGSLSLMPLFVIFIGNTHLGATLMRVYERREDRHAYRLFALWVTLAIAALCLAGLWVVPIGSVLLTLYLTFVPWHFTGQNYGVSLVFLRRRGIEVDARLKRFIWTFFFTSYLLWVLALHAARPGTADYAPLSASGTIYGFLPLGVPEAALPWLAIVLGLVCAVSLLQASVRLIRRAPARELLPTAGVALSQALWFALPVLGTTFLSSAALGPFAELWKPGNSASTFLWISVVHSAQYLWITDYYVRRERPGTSRGGFMLKSLLAAMAIFGVPLLLLAPGLSGGPSYDAGLYTMLAGALNLHHVVLDSVIWKLRNARIASILIRGDAPPAAPKAGRSLVPKLVFASGALGVVLMVASLVESDVVLTAAVNRDDAPAVERSLERLTWMGRDHSLARARLGYLRWRNGDLDAALQEYERSVALRPNAAPWLSIGKIREQRGEVRKALDAYDHALALAPREVDILVPAGRAAHRLGDVGRARELLARAAQIAPERADVRQALAATGPGPTGGARAAEGEPPS